ncbi:Helix-turn-helix [Chitinophaga sp. YR573]|uniref:helix-turn-helix domain-containing protein n=1 Tax=Chitinophaga sp. YR573 TaxID=1881040 RepID=UPI0008B9CE46|nr:helix-turn-helix domain-containing protein [Chitinophaga sp. YR573]SEW35791.1 Helix-turn-helix [Chitinophaga sp. YR573]
MYQLTKKDIACLIKEGRVIQGYTQQELSELTGISLRSIQRIENEEVLPRSYTIRVLATQLGVLSKLTQQESRTPVQEITKEPEIPPVNIEPSQQVNSSSFPPKVLNKPRRIILSIGIGVLLILGTAAFIAQSAKFPETPFECLLLWMGIAGAYMITLLMLWK